MRICNKINIVTVYLVYKRGKIKINGFSKDKKVAQIYVDLNNDKNLYVQETQMNTFEYMQFRINNKDKEILCYRLESTDELIIIRKKDKEKMIIKSGTF